MKNLIKKLTENWIFGISGILFMSQSGMAQIPNVVQGFPNTTQVPGKLLYRSPNTQNRITNIGYMNGWFYTNMVTGADNKVWSFSNKNDASTFGIRLSAANGDSIPSMTDHGNHGHTSVPPYLGGVFGMAIKRVSDGVNGFSETLPDFNVYNQVNSGHILYWPWILPFHWIQYAGMNSPTPTTITRPSVSGPPRSVDLFAWNSLAEDGVTGNSILLGNLLFITSDDSKLGILAYDISPVFKTPAERPILLDKLTGTFGAYIAVLFENYIVLSDQGAAKVDIIDISDPTDLKHVRSINTAGTPALRGDQNVSYVQCQDNFIFAQRMKIDMTTFTPVLELDQVGDNRPAGSAVGPIDTSQYMMPIGNLLITGGYSFGPSDNLGVWAHQAAPDTTGPYVGYHVPRPGQTNFPVGAPVSILIHETLEPSTIINGISVILREVGTTTPIDCWISFSHDDMLTITPKQYLALNKTYEVVLPANGIKDAAGNGMQPYTFTFSTGASVAGGNASPVLSNFTALPSPTTVGTTVTLSATASDPEGDPLQYRFIFGDSSPSTNWTSSPTATRAYTSNGHFNAKVQVRDTKPGGSTSTVTKSLVVTVSPAIVGTRPTNSSTIALNNSSTLANRRVWTVNPDADTVTILNADTNAKIAEYDLRALLGIPTSADPRNVAVDAAGNAWVTCHDADRIAVISPAGTLVGSIATGYGSVPYGVAMTPDRSVAFVTLFGSGVLKRYNTSTRAETGSINLGPTPRAIAITGDASRVVVTRFTAALNRTDVWDVANTTPLTLTRTIPLVRNFAGDTSSNGRGILNQLAGITISPDNQWAWITCSKMNDEHGTFFTGLQNTENTVRAAIARIRLADNQENFDQINRIDVDNSESPTSVVFSPRGTYAFVTLQGNNEIAVFDDISLRAQDTKSTKWRFPTDLAPQGAVMDIETNKIFVNNFMARNVSVHNVTDFLVSGARTPSSVKVPTATTERLSSNVLAGKQIFYNASLKDALDKDAMSKDTYMSCATCHLDGAFDGRTWDFTQRGEGFRNTTDLRGRAGMAHGNVHWSGNFDEIQDFENDIRAHFGGTGLINAASVSSPLGTPKTGLSTALDQLASYVASLDRDTLPKSPFRNADGSMTAAAIAGKAVFESQSCTDCHGGANYSNSRGGFGVVPRLENVGTMRTSSGGRLGDYLAGIDTPTLLGIHATAPYFHDGSADVLAEVFQVAGGTVYQMEDGVLAGATERPGFININFTNSVHKNGLVQFNGAGSVTFNNIRGGTAAGQGALDFRFSCAPGKSITVTVNGTPFPLALQGEQPGWQTNTWMRSGRLEGFTLNPGNSNTIVVSSTMDAIAIDDMTVSTSNDLAKANPHRKVRALSTTDQNNLIAYLQQLDGSSPAAPDNNAALAAFRASQSIASDGSADTATPAGDGVANLLKYAFNMIGSSAGQRGNVNQPNVDVMSATGSAGLPLITIDSEGYLVVTYVRRKASESPGIRYEVQFSNDLLGWSTNSAAVTGVTSLTTLLERVVVRDSQLTPRRFARVLVAANAENAPIIISPIATTVNQGAPFSYSIAASDNPTSYTAVGLPPGISINSATGILSGNPTTSGTFVVTIGATNAAGTVNTQLTITVSLLPPVINSPTTATVNIGSAFNYQITATQFVSSFSASPLPPGLSVNTTTGLISGTPTLDGVYVVNLTATNAAASDTETLTITVNFVQGPNPTGVRRDYWTGIGGGSISDLTSNPNFPANPTGSDILPRLRATNWSNPAVSSDWGDNYGQRLRAILTAPATGNYVFWVSSDDASQFWISPTSNPAGRVMVAQVSNWTNVDEWNKETTQRSSNNSFTFNGGAPGVITLTAGQTYYIEVLHKQGAGGNHLSAGWRTPASGAGSEPAQIVPTSVLVPFP